jgi:ABC-type spermidine/putrescine transport system permease subunit II
MKMKNLSQIMKKDALLIAIPYVLGFVALSFGGRLYSTGASFARWDGDHNAEYFTNMHARLLESAGIAILALVFALYFGLQIAFSRIRLLEALVEEQRKRSVDSTASTGRSQN